MSEMETRTEKSGSVISVADKGNPKISGDRVVIFGNSNIQDGGKIGGNYVDAETFKTKTVGQNSNINKEGDNLMDCGLLIMDPKRRRVDEIEHTGPRKRSRRRYHARKSKY